MSGALRGIRLHIEPLVPNKETIAAMEAAGRDDPVTVGKVDGIMADRNTND